MLPVFERALERKRKNNEIGISRPKVSKTRNPDKPVHIIARPQPPHRAIIGTEIIEEQIDNQEYVMNNRVFDEQGVMDMEPNDFDNPRPFDSSEPVLIGKFLESCGQLVTEPMESLRQNLENTLNCVSPVEVMEDMQRLVDLVTSDDSKIICTALLGLTGIMFRENEKMKEENLKLKAKIVSQNLKLSDQRCRFDSSKWTGEDLIIKAGTINLEGINNDDDISISAILGVFPTVEGKLTNVLSTFTKRMIRAVMDPKEMAQFSTAEDPSKYRKFPMEIQSLTGKYLSSCITLIDMDKDANDALPVVIPRAIQLQAYNFFAHIRKLGKNTSSESSS